MDLVSSLRKQGSRGGVNFNWEDVASSERREHYLGNSLMAPVGRWQKSRDISWFSKDKDKADGDGSAEDDAQKARKEELARVKAAEEAAMAHALGLPPGMLLGTAAGGRQRDEQATEAGATGANAIAVPASSSRVPVRDEERLSERDEKGRARHRDGSRDRRSHRHRDGSRDRRSHRHRLHRHDRHREHDRDRHDRHREHDRRSRSPRHRSERPERGPERTNRTERSDRPDRSERSDRRDHRRSPSTR